MNKIERVRPTGKIIISRIVRMTEPAPERFMPINELYEISNLGNVRTRDTKRYLNINSNPVNKYCSVSVKIDGRWKTQYVHRLAAVAFNLPRPNGHNDIDHKDDNRLNNNIENIEWVPHSENVRRSYLRNPNRPRRVPGPRNTNTGERYISKREQKYKRTNGIEETLTYYSVSVGNTTRSFKTLPEAVTFRDNDRARIHAELVAARAAAAAPAALAAPQN